MICYLDMTFCAYYLSCAHPCDRALTPEVERAAKEAGLPVCEFQGLPMCWDEDDTEASEG